MLGGITSITCRPATRLATHSTRHSSATSSANLHPRTAEFLTARNVVQIVVVLAKGYNRLTPSNRFTACSKSCSPSVTYTRVVFRLLRSKRDATLCKLALESTSLFVSVCRKMYR